MTKLNRTFRLAAAGLCLAGVTAPAFAQPQNRMPGMGQFEAATEQRVVRPRVSQTAQDSNRRICVRASLSGSRITRQICHTQAEWNSMGGLPE